MITLTAGTVLLMWMGELITKQGVGNGISLLIFASILVALPTGIRAFINGGPMELFFPLIAIGVIVAVVFIQEGQRRIPIQYAKRMVGRRMTSGGSTYMPLRVNMAGVIPIIFGRDHGVPAHDRAVLPGDAGLRERLLPADEPALHAVPGLPDRRLHLLLHGGAVQPGRPGRQPPPLRRLHPGDSPGPPTAQYLDRVLTRLTLPGAIYLALVATLPTLFIRYGGFSQATAGALGGTSVLIAVGVALDTMRQMEAQMMQRSYEGFLK